MRSGVGAVCARGRERRFLEDFAGDFWAGACEDRFDGAGDLACGHTANKEMGAALNRSAAPTKGTHANRSVRLATAYCGVGTTPERNMVNVRSLPGLRRRARNMMLCPGFTLAMSRR